MNNQNSLTLTDSSKVISSLTVPRRGQIRETQVQRHAHLKRSCPQRIERVAGGAGGQNGDEEGQVNIPEAIRSNYGVGRKGEMRGNQEANDYALASLSHRIDGSEFGYGASQAGGGPHRKCIGGAGRVAEQVERELSARKTNLLKRKGKISSKSQNSALSMKTNFIPDLQSLYQED